MRRLMLAALETQEQHDPHSRISNGTGSLGSAVLRTPFFAPLKLTYYIAGKVRGRKHCMWRSLQLSLPLCLFFNLVQ